MFGRKKKKESAVQTATATQIPASLSAVAEEEAQKRAQQAKEMQETNKRLSQARATKDEIDRLLNELRYDPEINNNMRKQARKNEKKLKALKSSRIEKGEKEDSSNQSKDSEMKNKSDSKDGLYNLEEGMYIIAEEIEGDVENNKCLLENYVKAVEEVSNLFYDKSAIDAVDMDADKLNAVLEEYILKLRKALEDGRSKTADACLTLLKYVIEVGYRFEGTNDPRKRKEHIEKKLEFVKDTGTQLISVITEYYNQLADYEITQASYNETYNAFKEKSVERLNMPDHIRQKIDRLGFKRAMKELPPGDEARRYLKVILDVRGELAIVYMRKMELESIELAMSQLMQGYNEYMTECQRAFVSDNDVFDYEAHQKRIFELHKRSVDNINRINDMAVANHDLNERTMSLLKEAAENPALGESVATAMQALEYYDKLEENNAVLEREIEKKKQENKKAAALKLKAEEEERQRIMAEEKELQQETQQEVQQENKQLIEMDI